MTNIQTPPVLIPILALLFSIFSLLVTPIVVWANYMLLEQSDFSLEQVEGRLYAAPIVYFVLITLSFCCGLYSFVKRSGKRLYLVLSALSLIIIIFSLVSFAPYMMLLLNSEV